MRKKEVTIVVFMVYLNFSVCLHENLHVDLDVLCHFSFAFMHYPFLFKMYKVLLNKELECFHKIIQLVLKIVIMLVEGNGYINHKLFTPTLIVLFKVTLLHKSIPFLVQAFVLINILFVSYLYFYCRLPKYFVSKAWM